MEAWRRSGCLEEGVVWVMRMRWTMDGPQHLGLSEDDLLCSQSEESPAISFWDQPPKHSPGWI